MAKRRTANHKWIARMEGVDFLRNDGGLYGVKLVMSNDRAERFSRNIERCVRNAHKFGCDEIEIDVHWSRRGKGNAFLITTCAITE